MKNLILVLFLSLIWDALLAQSRYEMSHGGIVRGDRNKKEIHLFFTGGDYGEGGDYIRSVLAEKQIPAHFFFTGDFYRAPSNASVINNLISDGHYLGAHSDRHLLYASWENRDSLLVTKEEFKADLVANYSEMERFGIEKKDAPLFMPPYEWYNDSISQWTKEMGLTLINFSTGTGSNADYTTPDMGNQYKSSQLIYDQVMSFEESERDGLKGFLLLLHIGTHPNRKDKFYLKLGDLIDELQGRGYEFTPFSFR